MLLVCFCVVFYRVNGNGILGAQREGFILEAYSRPFPASRVPNLLCSILWLNNSFAGMVIAQYSPLKHGFNFSCILDSYALTRGMTYRVFRMYYVRYNTC